MIALEFFLLGIVIIFGFFWQIRLFQKDADNSLYSFRYYAPPILGLILITGMIGYSLISEITVFRVENIEYSFIEYSEKVVFLFFCFWFKSIFGPLLATWAAGNFIHVFLNYGYLKWDSLYTLISKVVVPELSEPFQLVYISIAFVLSISTSVMETVN